MAIHTFDFSKTKPAAPGQRRDYIKPGSYRFRVIAYDDKASSGGKEMHTFSSEVISKGSEQGKKITDRFAMPKSSRESQYPIQRLLAFFDAVSGKKNEGKKIKIDPARLKGKEFMAEIFDKQEEARKVGDTQYPARTVSELQYGVEEDEDAEDEEDEEDDEEDEEEDDDEEEEDEEDDEDEDEEDDDDEEDEEEEEEEEPEPAPRAKKSSTKTAAKPAAKSAKPAAKAAVKTAAKKSSKAKAAADDDDFPFED